MKNGYLSVPKMQILGELWCGTRIAWQEMGGFSLGGLDSIKSMSFILCCLLCMGTKSISF